MKLSFKYVKKNTKITTFKKTERLNISINKEGDYNYMFAKIKKYILVYI